MSKQSKEFIKHLLVFFPSVTDQYRKSIEENGELLETVVIEDIFMPEIINLLKDNKNTNLLNRIFAYFETMANCEDIQLENIFMTTVLECLGNDKTILKKAREYMGHETLKLQLEADKALGRN